GGPQPPARVSLRGPQRVHHRGGAAMPRVTHRHRMAPGCLLSLLTLVAWFGMVVPPAFPEDGPSASPGQTQTRASAGATPPPAAVPAGARGMLIYIDPPTA